LLREHFVCSGISSIPRACNSVSYELAKVAMCWDPGDLYVWANPLLEFVKTLVALDLVEAVFPISRP
jgi:hypothetical protein